VSTFKRGTAGFYYYDYVLDGVRFAGSTKKRTKREANVFEFEHRAKEEAKRTASPAQLLTLSAAVDRMFEEEDWHMIRTGNQVRARMEVVFSVLGKDTLLSAIDDSGIKRVVAHLRGLGLEESTVNRYRAHLKTLLITAYRKWKAIPGVPYIQITNEPNGRLRFFSHDEETAILDLLRAGTPQRAQRVISWNPYPEAADLFTVLVDTGMRLMEAVSMESRDVNMATNLIHIWKNKADKPRSVPMTDRVRAIVGARLGRERIFLFTDQKQINRVWRMLRKALPWLADAVPHTFRHTTASRLVQNGVDLYVVQKMLGHSTIRVTEKYAHLAPGNLKVAVDALNHLHQSALSASIALDNVLQFPSQEA